MDYTKDTRAWELMKKNLLSLNTSDMKIGWFEGQKYGEENSNLPMAHVALLNEEGHKNGPDAAFPNAITPPRPYVKVGYKDYLKDGRLDQSFSAIIITVLEGEQTLKAYKKAAPYFVKGLQKTMDAWDSPPNARLTRELKGFNDPLNKTHALIDNVSSEVSKTDKE